MAEGLYIALQGSTTNYVYNQLCAVLDNRYEAAMSAAMDNRKLKEGKKKKGESYADLGQYILGLA